MRKIITLAALIIVLASFGILFSACRNEGWLVNKSQPWYENGHYHNTPNCGTHQTIHYITIMDDEDSEHSDGYSSSASDSGFYSSSTYKSKGYRYSRRKGHTYLTYPVSVPEYSCIYI